MKKVKANALFYLNKKKMFCAIVPFVKKKKKSDIKILRTTFC